MSAQTTRVTLCLAGLALASQAGAADLALSRDGWTSWQVAAVEGAPDMCCWSRWDDNNPLRTACALEDQRGNVGSRDHATTDAIRVYARVAGGKVERLRVFAASCPVKAATEIHQLDNVAADDSARWLVKLSGSRPAAIKRDDLGDDVLTALAMHAGDIAQDALAAIARGDGSVETRKKAIFWLGHMRGGAGTGIVSSLMFNDRNPDVRKHAAFAITQSKSPRAVAPDLIRLGNTDTDGDVRAQAWFWLAHTGAAESEAAVVAALKKDSDKHVREQAIFALSQLPEERATRALIAVAEDRSLSPEQRKRAVFWLAQSESDGAQAYMEKVLVGKLAD